MLKFITISNNHSDSEQILACKGNLFVTKLENKQIILCSNITTFTQEINYRAANSISFLPVGAQANMYASANLDRKKTWMYATEPISISGLIYNGHVVATSKTDPLILYYTYKNNQLSLFLYNLKTHTTNTVISKTASSIENIEKCQFQIGAFTNSKQQDIFASCNLLNITNRFFMQADQYQQSDRGLSNWCNVNGIIKQGDFNGDRLTDLICINTRSAMINKIDSFVEVLLIKNQPGNWKTQFIIQSNMATGDFDGNGLSDFVSLTDNANPQILFSDGLSSFISYNGNINDDGSVIINSSDNWCGTNSNAQLIAIDIDNDGKDDLLCQNNDHSSGLNGAVYLALSRTDRYRASANNTISKVVVTLEDYNLGSNINHFILDKNAPIFCDASKLFEYHTQVSCALNSPNKVDLFTNPIRFSNAIPRLEINSHIQGSIYLGDAEKYDELNLNEDHVYNEIPDSRFQFPKSKSWKLESKKFIDPTRNFDTRISSHYIRQGRVKEQKQHLGEQIYSHEVHGGDCNEINFSHITLVNQFTATGKIKAYDQNNNQIMDHSILRNLANFYVLSGNTTSSLGTEITTQISNVAGGIVSFAFNGEIQLQTLYQKNVTQCTIKGISKNDLINNQVTTETILEDQSSLCLLESETPLQYTNTATLSGSTRGPSLLTRTEILEINGIICAGGAFFPDIIKNNTESLQIDRYSTQISDISSQISYNNSITLNAYVRNNGQFFAQPPHNELMIDFTKNGKVIYEPTRIKFPNGTISSTPAALYAGFDNIKLVKIAAFDPTHLLLAWTIYIAEEKQYYALVDYVNTGNDLLRIPLYEQNFDIVIADQRFGNEFYVSYRSSPDSLIISRYSAESFALSKSIEVGVNDFIENKGGNSRFILQVEEIPASATTKSTNSSESESETGPISHLVVVRTHNDNKGLFIKKFDIFLNEIVSEANIICDNSNSAQTQHLDSVPSKIDEGYDTLRLDYQHNSKIIYHSADKNYNLKKKIGLQNGLNSIYKGINHLQSLVTNKDQITQSQVKSSFESLVCKSTLQYAYLDTAINKFQELLKSDLTFELHTATSNPNCKVNGYYPVYRTGNTVHLCSNFDFINTMNECNRLINLSKTTKSLILPTTSLVLDSVLSTLLPFFPNSVISGYTQVINSDNEGVNNLGICDNGDAYTLPINQQTNQQSNNYANHIVNSLTAGLVSLDAPKTQVILNMDLNGCLGMSIRGCASSYDKQYNMLCMSYLFEAAATASIITEAADTNIDVRYNCATGCNLDSPALAKLTSNVGGYLTKKIEQSFIPTDSAYKLAKINQINIYGTKQETSFATSSTKILKATPSYFYDKDASLITFAYLGNDFIDLRSQYFRLNSTTPLGTEQFLGRFLNVAQIQTIGFSDSDVLVGYSVKHPTQDNYNILVQYISAGTSATSSRVLNIYPSYNGVFALDIVPSTNAANGEFIVSYPDSNNQIKTKIYRVTTNRFTEQLQVSQTINAIPDSTMVNTNITLPSLFVNAFLDNTFNVIWSNLDQSGINIQRYDMQTGDKIGNAETISGSNNNLQYPEILKVGAGDASKTIVTWQNQDQVYLNMISQTPTEQIPSAQFEYKALNLSAYNYILDDTKIVDEDRDVISLSFKNNNNGIKILLFTTNSSLFQFEEVLQIDDKNLHITANNTQNITTVNNTDKTKNIQEDTVLNSISDLLGKTFNSNINNCQNPFNNERVFNVEDTFSKAQDILKERLSSVDQLQAALNTKKMKVLLNQFKIENNVVYKVLKQVETELDKLFKGADYVDLATIDSSVKRFSKYFKPNVSEVSAVFSNNTELNTDIDLGNIDSIFNDFERTILNNLHHLNSEEEIAKVHDLFFQRAYDILTSLISVNPEARTFLAESKLQDWQIAVIVVTTIVFPLGVVAATLFLGALIITGLAMIDSCTNPAKRLPTGEPQASGEPGKGQVIWNTTWTHAYFTTDARNVYNFICGNDNNYVFTYTDHPSGRYENYPDVYNYFCDSKGARKFSDDTIPSGLDYAHKLTIATNKPYTQTTWLTAHNAFANQWAGYLYLMQEFCVPNQLRFGVRGFMLDVYYEGSYKDYKDITNQDHTIGICHGCDSFGKIKMFSQGLKVGDDDGGDDEDFKTYADYFYQFQKRFPYPSSLITVIFEFDYFDDLDGSYDSPYKNCTKKKDQDKANEKARRRALKVGIFHKGIIKHLLDAGYKESQILKNEATNLQKTVDEMWNSGIRLVLFSHASSFTANVNIVGNVGDDAFQEEYNKWLDFFFEASIYSESKYSTEDTECEVQGGLYYKYQNPMVVNYFGEGTTTGDWYVYPNNFNHRHKFTKLVTNCAKKTEEQCSENGISELTSCKAFHPVEFINACRQTYNNLRVNAYEIWWLNLCINLVKPLAESLVDTNCKDPDYTEFYDDFRKCFTKINGTSISNEDTELSNKDGLVSKIKYVGDLSTKISSCTANMDLWRLDCLDTFVNKTNNQQLDISTNVTRCYPPANMEMKLQESWFFNVSQMIRPAYNMSVLSQNTSMLTQNTFPLYWHNVTKNFTPYNCTELTKKYDLINSCSTDIAGLSTGNVSSCVSLGCMNVNGSNPCNVEFYNSTLTLNNRSGTLASSILNDICFSDSCKGIVKNTADQYIAGCTDVNIKALRPTFLALDFVNRGAGDSDRDKHYANCFFGDIAKRKELTCHEFIYDYIECHGITKQVINISDYDC